MFLTANGATILVGRNAHQNDELIKTRKSNVLWFHVKARPGSHVLLYKNDDAPNAMDVKLAARYALYYSSVEGKHAGVVHYCPLEQVVKRPEDKPGLVFAPKCKSLKIAWDPTFSAMTRL
jgi:predicted ribosome quality control (RQC) complex YloA/Tae2 family protein